MRGCKKGGCDLLYCWESWWIGMSCLALLESPIFKNVCKICRKICASKFEIFAQENNVFVFFFVFVAR